MNTQTLKTLVDVLATTEQSLQSLYGKAVDELLLIARPNRHSAGNYVTINTHPNGHSITPARPQYTIASGREGHYWGTCQHSGGYRGIDFFNIDDGELTNLNPKELVNLIRFLEKTDTDPAK